MIILIGNIGSTSLKSKLLKFDQSDFPEFLGEANLDRINSDGDSTFSTCIGSQAIVKDVVQLSGIKNGIQFILDWYIRNNIISSYGDIDAMGFKCVMGITNGANLLTPEILAEMNKFGFIAPAHNLPYIKAIDEFKKVLNVPMIGIFEPSFHYSLPEFKRFLGIPWEWNSLGIKKLGFHGASHRYLSAMAYQLLGRKTGKVITVHLGGSSSVCAVLDGKSVDIDQHFSPNSGLLQGTRIGDADVSAVLFAMHELGISVIEAQDMLSHKSGLKSMAGLGTEDCRTIEQAALQGNNRAQMTLDLYVDGIRKHIGAFATVLGGVDCIVFSGGTGENSQYIRELCLQNMEFMGIVLDPERNQRTKGGQAMISDEKSKVKVYVVSTNEELVVAQFTKQVLEKGRDLLPEEMEFSLLPANINRV
jgi:acetate kinase